MADLTGQQVDQYRIEQYIASGGMAEVYQAWDVNLQRPVALKVLRPELSKMEAAVARFHREARTVARLNHPNIIQIYGTGTLPNGQPYLAMPYIEGGSLQTRLAQMARKKEHLPVNEVLMVGRQVADALVAAHQAGVVHRDLKPSNVLLQSEGTADGSLGLPILSDLGIAAVQLEATRLTHSNEFVGTPHYMSPEQANGHPVDGRTDIYALGIILYELMAGRPPFTADSPLAVLHQHLYEPPAPLATLAPGLTPATYRAVETCLQKKPEHRFQTAADLVVALDYALVNEGYATPTTPGRLPAYPQVKRPSYRPPLWLMVGLGVVLLLLLAGSSLLFAWPPNVLSPTATHAGQVIVGSTSLTPTAVPLSTSEATTAIATATPSSLTLTAVPTSISGPTALNTSMPSPTLANTTVPTPAATPTAMPSPIIPPITADNPTAYYLATPPLIDGSLADWPLLPAVASAYRIQAVDGWDGTEDLTAVWQLGWDEQYLYLAVTVTDDTHVQIATGDQIFRGDSVDIQVDSNLRDGLNRWDSDVFQITFSPGDFQTLAPSAFRWQGNAQSQFVPVTVEHIQVAAAQTVSGYILEAAVPWTDLAITPVHGLVFGIALNASDNDTPGTAVQEVFYSHIATRQFRNPRTWGTVTLAP
jgi:serine/threonine-protein kinase